MKIALINNLYEPVARGGAESLVRKQAEMLRQSGHKVVIITTRPWGSGLAKKEDGLSRVGGLPGLFYHLEKLPKPLRLIYHSLSLLDLMTPWLLSLKLAYTGCQLAVGHNLTGLSLWLPRFISGYGIPYFQVLHDAQYLHPSGLIYKGREKTIDSLLAKAYQKITAYALEPAVKIISPSVWLGRLCLEKKITSDKQLSVLPNPNSIETIKETTIGQNFIFIGQIEPHKGIRELISAYLANKLTTELWVVGSGSLSEEMKTLAKEDRRIKFFGRLSRQEYLELMKKSLALIAPSICYENQPTVIIEAFGMGLPVLGSDFGGIAELLADGCGLAFDPLNQAAINQALTDMTNLSRQEITAINNSATKKISARTDADYKERFKKLLGLID
jgi:glycosyltransferase involved in cell wall biosynthesis